MTSEINNELVRLIVKEHKKEMLEKSAKAVFDYCEKLLTYKVNDWYTETNPVHTSITFFETLLQRFHETFINHFDLIEKDTRLYEEFYEFINTHKKF